MYCFRENSNFPFSNQKIITLVINKCNMAKNSAMWNVHIESMILVLTVIDELWNMVQLDQWCSDMTCLNCLLYIHVVLLCFFL
jgi:hypothetical protein